MSIWEPPRCDICGQYFVQATRQKICARCFGPEHPSRRQRYWHVTPKRDHNTVPVGLALAATWQPTDPPTEGAKP